MGRIFNNSKFKLTLGGFCYNFSRWALSQCKEILEQARAHSYLYSTMILSRNQLINGKIQQVVTYFKDIIKILNVGLSLSNSMLCTLDVSYGKNLSKIIKIGYFSQRDLHLLIDIYLERLCIERGILKLLSMQFMTHFVKLSWKICH